VVDDGDVYGRGVADGEFVVAGGEAAVAFERVDAAFDGVPVLVGFRIERGWSAATAASSLAVRGMVDRDRDGRADAAPGEPGPVGA
jgi:hypothetical protein